MWNLCYFHPFTLKKRSQLYFADNLLVHRRLVDYLRILQLLRQGNQAQVQVDVLEAAAAAPIAHVVLDEYLVVVESVHLFLVHQFFFLLLISLIIDER